VELPATVSMDPDGGKVTITAPEGGWEKIQAVIPQVGQVNSYLDLRFTLRAPGDPT
jgi:hypothetical protein